MVSYIRTPITAGRFSNFVDTVQIKSSMLQKARCVMYMQCTSIRSLTTQTHKMSSLPKPKNIFDNWFFVIF